MGSAKHLTVERGYPTGYEHSIEMIAADRPSRFEGGLGIFTAFFPRYQRIGTRALKESQQFGDVAESGLLHRPGKAKRRQHRRREFESRRHRQLIESDPF
jgi:hypothetical protein